MAAPNIISVGLITAGTQTITATTGGATLLSNGAATGYVIKVNMVMIANIVSNAQDITLNLVRSTTTAGPPASTAGTYALAYTVTVPEKSTLVLIGKDTVIYLQEGDSLQVIGTANSSLQAFCSYEIITQATSLP